MALRIAFLHPDLGIGGAERLVVDAALGQQRLGHDVTLYTSHCDPDHSFPETQDGTLHVQVHADWFPRRILGMLWLVCTIIRMLLVTRRLIQEHRARPFDVVVVDQLAIPVPLLRWCGLRVIFYGHFPDKLLARHDTFLQRLYRAPLDYAEEVCTASADMVVVNSNFTADVFRRAFPSSELELRVLYPPINTMAYEATVQDELVQEYCGGGRRFFLSINRYERKKNVALALKAFQRLLADSAGEHVDGVQLVVAGGYDMAVAENREYKKELEALAEELGIRERVHFLCSVSEELKHALLSRCIAVLYTPSNEHFGIVPVECMYMERPVVAVNNGGPTESIVDGETGFLRPAAPEEWARAMELLLDGDTAAQMGKRGRERVKRNFSLHAFASKFDRFMQSVVRPM